MCIKIAVISFRPFGELGTLGTYMLIEELNQHHKIRVFAMPSSNLCVRHFTDLPLIPLGPGGSCESLFPCLRALAAFKPDVIYLFNVGDWYSVLALLKQMSPGAKCILDLQSPLLLPDGGRRTLIQKSGSKNQHFVDKILTFSKQNPFTWIPDCTVDTTEYPLGLDMTFFSSQRKNFSERNNKFVFIGTIDPKRNIKGLVEGFFRYARMENIDAVLDIYGVGKGLKQVETYIETHGMQDHIRLKGKADQQILFPMLSEYDVGIAWVPLQIYSDSPSLKLLEYMAAHLPVLATSTNAHRALLAEGFEFALTEDEPGALANALKGLKPCREWRSAIASNRKLVHQYEYANIVPKHINPVIASLTSSPEAHPQAAALQSARVVGNNLPREQTVSPVSPRLKLLFWCPRLAKARGGPERVALDLAEEMRRRGHLVYVMYHSPEGTSPKYTVKEDIILVPFEKFEILPKMIAGIDPSVFTLLYTDREALSFGSYMQKTNIPLCLHESFSPQKILQETWWSKNSIPSEAGWEREILASRAARIQLTMSDYADSFSAYIRLQVRCFPNPAFPRQIFAEPGGKNSERKIIITVNGFRSNKNLPLLLEVFASLADEFADWDLKVVGWNPRTSQEREPYHATFQYIRANRLEERIIFTDSTEDIIEHYASAHIHVLASFSEGCPTTILEAMSVGLPSIGYADCSGTNQLISHEENGLLASPENRMDGLRSALERLMASSQLRESLGKQARLDARQFEPTKIYDQWEQMLYDAAEYKNDPDRLFREQASVSREHALHARRMRESVLRTSR